ncbi:MAG: hypothetical protein Q7S87_14305 [Agitococcus sp.]|nr:hypothetical protein [Agitococcus sp.]
MTVIYLDTCALQRPLDDQTQIRIYLEAEAILAVLRLVEVGQLSLLSSDILIFEISRIPNVNRKSEATTLLKLAHMTARVQDNTKALSQQIMMEGIKPLDAAHVAIAIQNQVSYFCTSDDKLLKKLKNLTLETNTRFVSPLELVNEVTE